MNNKLYRSSIHKVFAGVCGGLAEYFDIDPIFIRALFIFLFITGGAGFLIYIILWILVPKKPIVFSERHAFNNSNYYSDPFNTTNYENFYNTTSDNETLNRAEEILSKQELEKRKSNFGIILIALGVLLFLINYFPHISFSIWAPILLIAIGVYKLYKNKYKKKQEKIY